MTCLPAARTRRWGSHRGRRRKHPSAVPPVPWSPASAPSDPESPAGWPRRIRRSPEWPPARRRYALEPTQCRSTLPPHAARQRAAPPPGRYRRDSWSDRHRARRVDQPTCASAAASAMRHRPGPLHGPAPPAPRSSAASWCRSYRNREVPAAPPSGAPPGWSRRPRGRRQRTRSPAR